MPAIHGTWASTGHLEAVLGRDASFGGVLALDPAVEVVQDAVTLLRLHDQGRCVVRKFGPRPIGPQASNQPIRAARSDKEDGWLREETRPVVTIREHDLNTIGLPDKNMQEPTKCNYHHKGTS